MEFFLKLIIVLLFIRLSHGTVCHIHKHEMNCTGMHLKDCPESNTDIDVLVMDENDLETLLTENCERWSHVKSLSVRNNKLRTLSDFQSFRKLKILKLRNNLLTLFNLSSNSLKWIDVSHNAIDSVQAAIHLPLLDNLNTSHNRLGHDGINILIAALHFSPFLRAIDLSHNLIERVPINFMTFGTTYLSSINFSGNRLKEVGFNHFQKTELTRLDLDFSGNRIVKWSDTRYASIHSLDLSGNQISTIEPDQFNFRHLGFIDLSRNPLSCVCSESGPFLNWMHRNRDRVLHQSETQCRFPHNHNVFNLSCQHSSSSSVLTPTTRPASTDSSSSSRPSTLSPSGSPVPVNGYWRVVVGILCPTLLILVVLLGCIIYRSSRGTGGYRLLDQASSWRASRVLVTDWLRVKFALLFSRTTESTTGDHHDDAPPATDCNDYSNNDDSLNIICCSRDTLWVTEELVPKLHLRVHIIDSKCKAIPFASFTLVVVNGKGNLKDHIFIGNLKKALSMKDVTEIRLLIRRMPTVDSLQPVNCVTDFVRRMVADKCFFNYDDISQSLCIESLGFWLNLDV